MRYPIIKSYFIIIIIIGLFSAVVDFLFLAGLWFTEAII